MKTFNIHHLKKYEVKGSNSLLPAHMRVSETIPLCIRHNKMVLLLIDLYK